MYYSCTALHTNEHTLESTLLQKRFKKLNIITFMKEDLLQDCHISFT